MTVNEVKAMPEPELTLAHLRVYLAARLTEDELFPESPVRPSLVKRLKQHLAAFFSVIRRTRVEATLLERHHAQSLSLASDFETRHYILTSNSLTIWLLKELPLITGELQPHAQGAIKLLSGGSIIEWEGHWSERRKITEQLFDAIVSRTRLSFSQAERERLLEMMFSDLFGLGPLDPLLADESISEIIVNGPRYVFIERGGQLSPASIKFDNETQILRIIERILAPLGRHVNETSPMADTRLQDGSRVNVAIRPVSMWGPSITIRKFPKKPWGIQDLIRFNSMTNEIAEFLRACLLARLNILITGSDSSGKTYLINVLSCFIPNEDRMAAIEHITQFQLQHLHFALLEANEKTTYRELVENATRMRPDRLIFGDIRGSEAFSALQALSMGYPGSLLELRAKSARDALMRLEILSRLANVSLSDTELRNLIASVIDVVVVQQRMMDGSRKIVEIAEVQGMEGDEITLATLFEFHQTDIDKGKVVGRIRPTGIVPNFIERIETIGIHIPPSVFGAKLGTDWKDFPNRKSERIPDRYEADKDIEEDV